LAEAGFEVRHAPNADTADGIVARWSPSAVVVRADDPSAIEWLAGLAVAGVIREDPASAGSASAVLSELETLGVTGGSA